MFNFTADKSLSGALCTVTCKQATSYLVEDTNLAASLQLIDCTFISMALLE